MVRKFISLVIAAMIAAPLYGQEFASERDVSDRELLQQIRAELVSLNRRLDSHIASNEAKHQAASSRIDALIFERQPAEATTPKATSPWGTATTATQGGMMMSSYGMGMGAGGCANGSCGTGGGARMGLLGRRR